MAALHPHDIARVAHEALRSAASTPPWADEDESERERWRVAAQFALNESDSDELKTLLSPDEIQIFRDLVLAMRPYTEEG